MKGEYCVLSDYTVTSGSRSLLISLLQFQNKRFHLIECDAFFNELQELRDQ